MTDGAPLPAEVRVLVLDRAGDLAARLRRLAGTRGVVFSCSDLAGVEAQLAATSWDVLVAGPAFMHRGGLRRLSSFHQRFPWVSIVLALQQRPRADLADVVQAGATDLFAVDASDGEVTAVLARAARITRGRHGAGLPPPHRGRVITIASASGGCGKTFLATNAAEYLARATDHPVVLVDLDLQFGEVSVALRLRPDFTIADALRAEAEGHPLDELIDDFLIPHPDGFSVLAAPRRPVEADSIMPGDVARILDALRARGAWVVVDNAEGLGELLVTALDATDHLFVLATPDRPSLTNLGTFLNTVDRLGMAAERISLVLNKAEPDLGLDIDEMAAHVGRPFAAVVPYSTEVSRSVNLGLPLVASGSKSAVTAALRTALQTAVADPSPLAHNPAGARPAPATRPVNAPAAERAPDVTPLAAATPPSAALDPAAPNLGAPDPVAPASPPAPDSTEPAVVLRPRRRHVAVERTDRRRPRPPRPARSGPVRPSKPALAATDCSERGPPLPASTCGPNHRDDHRGRDQHAIGGAGPVRRRVRTRLRRTLPALVRQAMEMAPSDYAPSSVSRRKMEKGPRHAGPSQPIWSAALPLFLRRAHGDAPVHPDVADRPGSVRNRRRRRPPVARRFRRRQGCVPGDDHHHDRPGRDRRHPVRRSRRPHQLHDPRGQAGRRRADALRRRSRRLRQGRRHGEHLRHPREGDGC
jgi:pilus assembly protein CpaE